MQFVTYRTAAGTTAGGYIADRATSPLTHLPRVLVVDSYAEAKDPIERGIYDCPVCLAGLRHSHRPVRSEVIAK